MKLANRTRGQRSYEEFRSRFMRWWDEEMTKRQTKGEGLSLPSRQGLRVGSFP
jgi:hypothetical protein